MTHPLPATTELHAAVASQVGEWRERGYPHDNFPALAEILHYAVEGEEAGAPFPQSGYLRYLRSAQLRALEAYGYLRVVEETPQIAQLYERLFERTADRLAAMGLDAPTFKDAKRSPSTTRATSSPPDA